MLRWVVQEQEVWLGIGVVRLRAGNRVRGPIGGAERDLAIRNGGYK